MQLMLALAHIYRGIKTIDNSFGYGEPLKDGLKRRGALGCVAWN